MKKRTPSILPWFAEVKPKFFDLLKSHVRQKTESFTAGLGNEIDEMVGQTSCVPHTFSRLVMFDLHFRAWMEEHWGCWWKLTDEGGQSALPRSLLTGSEISPSKKRFES